MDFISTYLSFQSSYNSVYKRPGAVCLQPCKKVWFIGIIFYPPKPHWSRGTEIAFCNANMASSLALVVICILSTSSYSSPTKDLLETVSRLLRDCSRFYSHADRNMAENLVVRLQVAVDSVRRLVESLDPDDQGNDVRIPELESLLRQLQYLLNKVTTQAHTTF